jgi:cytochrome P450
MATNHAYPPGPKGRFSLSTLRRFQNERLAFLESNREQYGDVVHFRIGLRDVYQLNNPDMIQQVLVKQPEAFYKTPNLKRITRQAIGEGLLTSEGDFHKRQRRLAQPAFHYKRIAAYADVMVHYTAQMLDDWHGGEARNIAQEMMKLTMRIVGKTLFDADVSAKADSIGAAITVGIETAGDRITRIIYMPDWVPTRKNHERRRAAQLIENTIANIINERRASGEDKGDLLSMLLLAVDEEDGGQMTNKQVRDEAMTLFIAGHETTANALTWTFYLLAQHPEIEARLVEEVQAVLDGKPATIADLVKLPHNEMVIHESMRLYPPAWIVSREVIEDIEIGGYPIKKGSILLMSTWVMHRHPQYWDEPERFNPQRFAPGWENHIPKYAYFPFGGGPRICIGNQFALMEARLVLATIIQRFHLGLVPGQTITPAPIITLRPEGGIQMALTARDLAAVPDQLIPV